MGKGNIMNVNFITPTLSGFKILAPPGKIITIFVITSSKFDPHSP